MHYIAFLLGPLAIPFATYSQHAIGLETSGYMTEEPEPVPLNLDSIKLQIGYPRLAKAAEIGGKVIVRILIDTLGRYERHIVLKDPHPLLTQAVTAQIPALRFSPARQDGKVIRCWVTIPFDFKVPRLASVNRQDTLPVYPAANAQVSADVLPAPTNYKDIRDTIGYPPMAMEAEIEGRVEIRCLVDKTGKLQRWVTTKDPHPILTRAVLAQIHNLRFTPASFMDTPVDCWVTVPFEFDLKGWRSPAKRKKAVKGQ